MTMRIVEAERQFHLSSGGMSYVMGVHPSGTLCHLYHGPEIRSGNYWNLMPPLLRAFCPSLGKEYPDHSRNSMPLECPTAGSGDFRSPAIAVELSDGSRVLDLRYQRHEIRPGKPPVPGLPSSFVDSPDQAMTLDVVLVDDGAPLEVVVSYTVFEGEPVLVRWMQVTNRGAEALVLRKAASTCVDFLTGDYDAVWLPGSWARERSVQRSGIHQGVFRIESTRGTSSHQSSPFVAIVEKDSGERHGSVVGLSLLYSGSFLCEVAGDEFSQTRVTMGLHPDCFSWTLFPGETFYTPEVVHAFSSTGLQGMSQTFHQFYRRHVLPPSSRTRTPPILLNNWEATYFSFSEDTLLALADRAASVGVDLFVLDDGWFGERDSDQSSLGDWWVNTRKLPSGLSGLAEAIRERGMAFGIWIEPEMVSARSELYANQPDWCLHVPNRRRTESRNQLVLNLARAEVCDHLIKVISELLSSASISYVKWDMNRHLTEVFDPTLPSSRQGEVSHRYVLGLYRVIEEITTRFPHILFEGCSGGGGRFDGGMLRYMPQIWTSDNTDAVCRMQIQYGTSLVFPPITMGAHVSQVPNHQVGRSTGLGIRGMVAMSGNLGYEIDLTSVREDELEAIRAQIAQYRAIRHLVLQGTFVRLVSPFEGNDAAWMFHSEGRDELLVFYGSVLAKPNAPVKRLRLWEVNPRATYEEVGAGREYGGDELMHCGLPLPVWHGDFQGMLVWLRARGE